MKNKNKTTALVVKLIVILSSIYLALLLLSIAAVFYFSYDVARYKPYIQNQVSTNSPYFINFDKITPSISSNFAPAITVNNLVITSPSDQKAKIKVGKILISLSYKSFIYLRPIFDQIYLSQSDIKIKILKNNQFLLNGFNFASKDNQTSSTLDWQYYVKLQPKIILNKISIGFESNSTILPGLQIAPTEFSLLNNSSNSHTISLVTSNKVDSTELVFKLKFRGSDLLDYSKWSRADLSVSIDKISHKDSIYHKYIPSWILGNNFATNSRINASLVDGKINKIVGKLDVDNIRLIIESKPVIFSKLQGDLNVVLVGDTYQINANIADLSTLQYLVLKNFNISANYNPKLGGKLNIHQIDLGKLSYLAKYLHYDIPMSMVGSLDSLELSYESNLFNPKSYRVVTDFNNIKLSNKNLTINNISGKISTGITNGTVSLNLVNSTMIESNIFLIPYKFNKLIGDIKWSIESHILLVTAPKLLINTPDFNVQTNGYYRYNFESKTNNLGYLRLDAKLDKIQASKVGTYLPKEIPMSVHKWLDMAIVGGYAQNAKLDFQGDLYNFPYIDSSGKFYITADIESADLHYDESWPAVKNIHGKFVLNNDNIYIKANSGTINDLDITTASADILHYTKDKVGLALVAKGTGITNNYLKFIKKSPVVQQTGDLSTVFNAIGNAILDLKLYIPFDNPSKSKVLGSVALQNNQINFNKINLPEINNINGSVNFTEKSVTANKLSSNLLGTPVSTSITTNRDNDIVISNNIKILDIQEVADYYGKNFADIQGASNYNVNVLLNAKGLESVSISSDLIGTKLNLPSPLYKHNSDKSSLQINYIERERKIDLALNDLLYAKVTLDNQDDVKHAELALGTNQYLNDVNSLISINSKFNTIQIKSWIDFIQKNQDSMLQHNPQATTVHKQDTMLLKLASDEIKFGDVSLGAGNGYVILTKTGNVVFTAYTNILVGRGNYQNDVLNLELDRYNVSTKNQGKNKISALDYSAIPDVNLIVNNFLINNISLGELTSVIKTTDRSIKIESTVIKNKDNYISISGYSKQISDILYNTQLDIHSTSNNYGAILDAFGLEKTMYRGKGSLDGSIKSQSNIVDFNLESSQISFVGNIKDGKLLKVNSGLMGSIIGLLNLQSIARFSKFGFNDIFSNGFVFNEITFNGKVESGLLNLVNFAMSGTSAEVKSNGIINLNTDKLNLFLSITPKLTLTVAVITTAITITSAVTIIAPIIAAIIYGSQFALGNPVNKLLTFSYNVTGGLDSPILTYVKISKQITDNIGNTVQLKQ